MTNQPSDRRRLAYTVLAYEQPGYGVWMKVREFDFQCLADALEEGLGVIEERLSFILDDRRRRGEVVPEGLPLTVKYVDKEGYGPTQIEIEEERQLEGFEERDEYECLCRPS